MSVQQSGSTAIAYIGKKSPKKDTVNKSGIIWAGFGDVQWVPNEFVQRLLAYPTVWVTAEHYEALAASLADEVTESEWSAVDDDSLDASDAVQIESLAVPLSESDLATDSVPDKAKKDAIINAILALTPGSSEHFTDSGKPKVAAVRALVGDDFTITTQEVNAAFAELGG